MPAAFVLQAVVVAADVAEIVLGRGSAAGVVDSVVGVGTVSGGAAANHDAVPVADLDVSAQRGAGESSSAVLGIGSLRWCAGG